MPTSLMQEAPLEVQRKAKCVIGKDYPAPIVDHKYIHKINIGRMKEAYDANKGRKSPSTAGSALLKKRKSQA